MPSGNHFAQGLVQPPGKKLLGDLFSGIGHPPALPVQDTFKFRGGDMPVQWDAFEVGQISTLVKTPAHRANHFDALFEGDLPDQRSRKSAGRRKEQRSAAEQGTEVFLANLNLNPDILFHQLIHPAVFVAVGADRMSGLGQRLELGPREMAWAIEFCRGHEKKRLMFPVPKQRQDDFKMIMCGIIEAQDTSLVRPKFGLEQGLRGQDSETVLRELIELLFELFRTQRIELPARPDLHFMISQKEEHCLQASLIPHTGRDQVRRVRVFNTRI